MTQFITTFLLNVMVWAGSKLFNTVDVDALPDGNVQSIKFSNQTDDEFLGKSKEGQ